MMIFLPFCDLISEVPPAILMIRFLTILVIIFIAHAWFNRGNCKTVPSILQNECAFVKQSSAHLVDAVKQKSGMITEHRGLTANKTNAFSSFGSTVVMTNTQADPSIVPSITQKIIAPAVDAEKKRVQELDKQINQANL
jgi:hypothetical protein